MSEKYSVLDTENTRVLHTGRNSDTEEEAWREAFRWWVQGSQLPDEDREKARDWDIERKKEWLKNQGFTVKSNEELKEIGYRFSEN